MNNEILNPGPARLRLVLDRMFKRYKRNPEVEANSPLSGDLIVRWTQDRDFTVCAIQVPGDVGIYMGASKRNSSDVPRNDVGATLAFKRALIDMNRTYKFFRRNPS